MGHVLELTLGVRPNGAAGPDFPALGVELKSVPVNALGNPTASTWVTLAPLDGSLSVPWAQSSVRAKLQKVLWIPILGDGPPSERRVGQPLWWLLDETDDRVLQDDWDLLTERIAEGAWTRLTAREGVALQLRPKAARANDWVWALDEEGEWVRTTPLGFYLRQRFTRRLFSRLRGEKMAV